MKSALVLFIFFSLHLNAQILTGTEIKTYKIKSSKAITAYPTLGDTYTKEEIFDTSGKTISIRNSWHTPKSDRETRDDFIYSKNVLAYSLLYVNDTLKDTVTSFRTDDVSTELSSNGKLDSKQKVWGDSLHSVAEYMLYQKNGDSILNRDEIFRTFDNSGKLTKEIRLETWLYKQRRDTLSFETTVYKDQFNYEVNDPKSNSLRSHYEAHDDTLNGIYTTIYKDEKGKYLKKNVVKRDKQNNLIYEEWYNKKNELESKHIFEYNSKGKIIKEQEFGKKNSLKGSTSKTYNEKGLLIDEKHFDKKNKVDMEVTYEYTYFR